MKYITNKRRKAPPAGQSGQRRHPQHVCLTCVAAHVVFYVVVVDVYGWLAVWAEFILG